MRSRLPGAAVGLVGGLVAAWIAAAPVALGAVTPDSTESPPPCTAGGLMSSFVGRRATTSSERIVLVLANVTSSPCGMIGYVGVTLLGPDGRPLVTDSERADSGVTATEVVVPPSGRASVVLSWDRADLSGGCVAPSALAVSPPNDPAPLVDAWPAPTLVCRFGRIDVTPVRPAARPVTAGVASSADRVGSLPS